MVPTLTMQQVDDRFRRQLDDGAALVVSLRAKAGVEEAIPQVGERAGGRRDPETGRARPHSEDGAIGRGNKSRPPLARRGARGRQADAIAVKTGPVTSPSGLGWAGTCTGTEGPARGRAISRAEPGHGTAEAGPPPPSRGRGDAPPAVKKLADEVEREMQRQREMAAELQWRVHQHGEIGLQQRMQDLQEKEALRAAQLAQAKAEIEAAHCGVSSSGGTNPVVPVYGPTGQRWDEPGHLLQAARPMQVDVGDLDARGGGEACRRRTRWSSGAEEAPAPYRDRRGRPAHGEAGDEGHHRGSSRSPRVRAQSPRRGETVGDGPFW